MPQNLPSKKVFAVAFLAIGILSWTIISKLSSTTPSGDAFRGVVSVAHAESMYQDSDNDGLPDWQEKLYGTDPNNPDSDGNGTPDGTQFESQKKYWGLVPNDSVFEAINRLGSDVPNAPDPTDRLSLSPTFYKDTFDQGDVTQAESGTSSASIYIAKALVLLAEHAEVGKSTPLDTIKQWLQVHDDTDANSIKQMGDDSKALASELIKIPVPPELVATHLDIANYLYDSGLALENVLTTLHDPTAGFFAGANYANYESKYTKAVIALTQYANTIYAK